MASVYGNSLSMVIQKGWTTVVIKNFVGKSQFTQVKKFRTFAKDTDIFDDFRGSIEIDSFVQTAW